MDKKMTVIMDFFSNKVNYGFGLEQTYTESTGAASTVYSDDIATRSSYTVGNSLYGNVLGLTTMQKREPCGSKYLLCSFVAKSLMVIMVYCW